MCIVFWTLIDRFDTDIRTISLIVALKIGLSTWKERHANFSSLILFLYAFNLFFSTSFELKNDGSRPCHLCDSRYSKITEEPLATTATRTAEVLKSLILNDETRCSVHLGCHNLSVNFLTLAGDLISVRIDLARLLDRSNRKQCPKRAILTHDPTEH